MAKRSYEKLETWQMAMALVTDVYKLTERFPVEERFGLASQLRENAITIPTQIAEGSARGSSKEFARQLYTVRGSLMGVETQLRIANNLGYIPNVMPQRQLIDKIVKKINATIEQLNGPKQPVRPTGEFRMPDLDELVKSA